MWKCVGENVVKGGSNHLAAFDSQNLQKKSLICIFVYSNPRLKPLLWRHHRYIEWSNLTMIVKSEKKEKWATHDALLDWPVPRLVRFFGAHFLYFNFKRKKTQKWTLEDHQRDSPQMPSPPLTQQDWNHPGNRMLQYYIIYLEYTKSKMNESLMTHIYESS